MTEMANSAFIIEFTQDVVFSLYAVGALIFGNTMKAAIQLASKQHRYQPDNMDILFATIVVMLWPLVLIALPWYSPDKKD